MLRNTIVSLPMSGGRAASGEDVCVSRSCSVTGIGDPGCCAWTSVVPARVDVTTQAIVQWGAALAVEGVCVLGWGRTVGETVVQEEAREVRFDDAADEPSADEPPAGELLAVKPAHEPLAEQQSGN